jgi:hypothetical protein
LFKIFFAQNLNPSQLAVLAGEHDFDRLEGGEVKLAVSEIRVHPWYDLQTYDNDIGYRIH